MSILSSSLFDNGTTASRDSGGGRADDAPRMVTRGAKWQRRSITVHWLRVVHPEHERLRLRAILVERFGEPDRVRGRWFYEHGEQFTNGALLLWGTTVKGKDGTCCVDVNGSALDSMEAIEKHQLCVLLSLGGRVTRVDLAADAMHSEGVGLIESIIASCKAGELCQAKRWEPVIAYESSNVVAYGVNIGRRGRDGSGRYVRAYDKGLETREQTIGRWERYEVEFTDDAASEVAVDVFGGASDWEWRAWNRLNGAVSFREFDPDRNDRHLNRRELVDWWAEWIEGSVPEPTVPKRVPTTLERYSKWLKETVLPTVARLAEEASVTWTDAMVHLTGHEVRCRTEDKYMRAMLAKWREMLAHRPVIAAT